METFFQFLLEDIVITMETFHMGNFEISVMTSPFETLNEIYFKLNYYLYKANNIGLLVCLFVLWAYICPNK